jgi:(1->4)-alpha-D-glucan 1-alpha-D-glucosylmutase
VTAGRDTRRPASTYRLQIHDGFDLFEAARRLPYLHDLGIDWVYLSPLLRAEPGSTHGYDVVAFDRLDESRGGSDGLAALSAEARRLGMGLLVDIVPNHVGVATPVANAWWWDVLEHGRGSRHADSFDIDWDYGHGRVRIPVLGDEDVPHEGGPTGHLEVVPSTGSGQGDELRYHDHRFPIAPGTIGGTADEVHARQHYELVGWRRGDAELNYRRFFTVTTLAGVRVEVPEVFAAAHTEVRRWFEAGLVDGLRIDHPDGLRDPEGYLEHLAGLTSGSYTLVEKILEFGEELPRGWAMDGTTGYDVLALLDRVLTDPAAEQPLTDLESRLRDGRQDWHRLVHDRKRAVADGSLLAETRRIVRDLPDLLPHHAERLEDAVAEVLACFPVYRSYLPAGQHHLDQALAMAGEERPDLADVLGNLAPVLADPDSPAALRFQQTSGMVMAKGVEDCSFYRTSRLTSLNEVGADPSVFSITPDEWHQAMAVRQDDWPHAMTTLTTHDTKRAEDVRARIAVLAEIPDQWEQALDRLLTLAPVPDPGFGSLLWQAVLGIWPSDGTPAADLRERLHGYAEKAMREAGDHTTWTDPDDAFETAVHSAVDAAVDNPEVRVVLDGLLRAVEGPGRSNSLTMKLVSITMPGVPDVYQGSEIEQRSLVDPDNRRPVDFDTAQVTLVDGTVEKQRITAAALRLRRDRAELFTDYTPLVAQGSAADHVLAFDRGGVVTVATRLPAGLERRGGWGDTTISLPEGRWRNLLEPDGGFDKLNRRPVAVGELLQTLPVALLVRED